MKTWVDSHPDDVITLLITNGDDIDITKFDDAFKAVGLDTYTFTPSGTLGLNDWPTLGDLISSGNRVVVFMGELPPIAVSSLPDQNTAALYSSTTNQNGRLQFRYQPSPIHPR